LKKIASAFSRLVQENKRLMNEKPSRKFFIYDRLIDQLFLIF